MGIYYKNYNWSDLQTLLNSGISLNKIAKTKKCCPRTLRKALKDFTDYKPRSFINVVRGNEGKLVSIGKGTTTRYINVQHNGICMGEHSKKMCLSLGIDRLPRGFYTHHLDGNKKNNDIHNLAIITITAHNRIHSHPSWNKGLRYKFIIKNGERIREFITPRETNTGT